MNILILILRILRKRSNHFIANVSHGTAISMPVCMAQLSSVGVAVRYVLPVLCMTSCLLIIGQANTTQISCLRLPITIIKMSRQVAPSIRGRSCCLQFLARGIFFWGQFQYSLKRSSSSSCGLSSGRFHERPPCLPILCSMIGSCQTNVKWSDIRFNCAFLSLARSA